MLDMSTWKKTRVHPTVKYVDQENARVGIVLSSEGMTNDQIKADWWASDNDKPPMPDFKTQWDQRRSWKNQNKRRVDGVWVTNGFPYKLDSIIWIYRPCKISFRGFPNDWWNWANNTFRGKVYHASLTITANIIPPMRSTKVITPSGAVDVNASKVLDVTESPDGYVYYTPQGQKYALSEEVTKHEQDRQ